MKTILCILAATALICRPGVAQVDSNAVKNAEQFLSDLKIADLPEGIQLINKNAWPVVSGVPVLSEFSVLFDGMFETDVAGVKGFKRLIRSKDDTRYLLVSYPDKASGAWRVYAFQKMTDTVEQEVSVFKSRLADPAIPRQFNYWHYSYWLGISGKLKDSLGATVLALKFNHDDPDADFPTECHENALAVKSIIGTVPAAP